jgi:hypothetical protein
MCLSTIVKPTSKLTAPSQFNPIFGGNHGRRRAPRCRTGNLFPDSNLNCLRLNREFIMILAARHRPCWHSAGAYCELYDTRGLTNGLGFLTWRSVQSPKNPRPIRLTQTEEAILSVLILKLIDPTSVWRWG